MKNKITYPKWVTVVSTLLVITAISFWIAAYILDANKSVAEMDTIHTYAVAHRGGGPSYLTEADGRQYSNDITIFTVAVLSGLLLGFGATAYDKLRKKA
jgi:general stress protein CsbA